MNVVRKEDIYTIDDIYALPDGERAELLDRFIICHHREQTIKDWLGIHISNRKLY